MNIIFWAEVAIFAAANTTPIPTAANGGAAYQIPTAALAAMTRIVFEAEVILLSPAYATVVASANMAANHISAAAFAAMAGIIDIAEVVLLSPAYATVIASGSALATNRTPAAAFATCACILRIAIVILLSPSNAYRRVINYEGVILFVNATKAFLASGTGNRRPHACIVLACVACKCGRSDTKQYRIYD